MSSPLTLTEEPCWICMAHVMSRTSIYMHTHALHGSKADLKCKDVVLKYLPVKGLGVVSLSLGLSC